MVEHLKIPFMIGAGSGAGNIIPVALSLALIFFFWIGGSPWTRI